MTEKVNFRIMISNKNQLEMKESKAAKSNFGKCSNPEIIQIKESPKIRENDYQNYQTMISFNFNVIDHLFNDLISQLQDETVIETYQKKYKEIKEKMDPHFYNKIFTMFKDMLRNLLAKRKEKKWILNILKKWFADNMKENSKISKHQCYDYYKILEFWKDDIEKNIAYKTKIKELEDNIDEVLKARKKIISLTASASFLVGNQRSVLQTEKRYLRFVSDMMFVVDSLNNDLKKGDYKPPSWS